MTEDHVLAAFIFAGLVLALLWSIDGRIKSAVEMLRSIERNTAPPPEDAPD